MSASFISSASVYPAKPAERTGSAGAQYQQQLTAHARRWNTPCASLLVPEEGNEAAWRTPAKEKWRKTNAARRAVQQRSEAVARHASGNHTEETEPAIPDGWRAIHDECVSLQSQLTAQQQQEALEQERLQQSQTQFAALSASCLPTGGVHCRLLMTSSVASNS
jgi:exonuclease SbcC